MKKIYCFEEFKLWHSDYAICGKGYSGKKYQCSTCLAKEKLFENPIVKQLQCCANCKHFDIVRDKPPYTDFRCSNMDNGWTYCSPIDICDRWEMK